jgi:hypothetical protein
MALKCTCPAPAALTVIPDVTCPVDFDQIVRLGFQRMASPSFFVDAANDIDEIASWTAFKAATDVSKIVISPYIANLVIPPSEGNFTGGDTNETVNGIAVYNGENTVTVTAEIHSAPAATIKALKALACESQSVVGEATLGAYFFTRKNQVVSGRNTANTTSIPVEIYNFRVSTVGSEGFNMKNKHMISFQMTGDWDDDVAVKSLEAGFTPKSL